VKQLAIAAGEIAFSSFLMLAVSIYAAGGRISRIWREEPPSARSLWLQKTFTTPIFWVSFFKTWMLRKLERNPIGWLEQRTWTGRVITWGWFAVIISIYSAVLTDKNFFVGYQGIQAAVGWLLCGSLAVSAAGSFRRERESGMLELLLVSPVGEGEIVFGRLRGLWGQFFPAFATLLVIWYYFATLFSGGNEGFIPFYALCFLTLPVIGLYYSLRCRQFMTAFLSTLAVGLALPMIVPGLMRLVWWFYAGSANNGPLFEYSSYVSCLQLGLAAVCWNRLYHRLVNRSFPLHRGEQ
jgi:ABC-type transport system involved in cytochrome c biogenesis permease component